MKHGMVAYHKKANLFIRFQNHYAALNLQCGMFDINRLRVKSKITRVVHLKTTH